MKLLLIRHGQTEWTAAKRFQGKSDIPLNQGGFREAGEIAEALEKYRPTRLYTSALQRAKETAAQIAEKLKLRPATDPRLNEIDFGRWEGSSYNDLSRAASLEFQKWCEGKLSKPPGGESIASLSRRVGKFLKETLANHSEETVALVSHGGTIKMFFHKVLKSERSSIWSFRIDPGSISLIEGDSSLLQIAWTNSTGHLTPSLRGGLKARRSNLKTQRLLRPLRGSAALKDLSAASQ